MKILLLLFLVILFALNMGGSNFAASFAAAYGSKILSRKNAFVLFGIFVFIGAVFIGKPVAETIGYRIIPKEFLTIESVSIVLISATISIFIANLIHVPQSTSLVTVSAILGIGLYYKGVYLSTLLYLVPFWFFFPVLGYLLTYTIGKVVYPPRKGNLWIYEVLVNNRDRLRNFVIIASCYNALSVGANNVANAVGPLKGAGIFGEITGFVLVAPLFGFGALLFHHPIKTAGRRIVPIGLFAATLVCFVTGTLIIIASILGIPQSFVMVKIAAILAISGLKNGHKITFANPVTKKTYLTWLVTPGIAVAISYILAGIRDVVFT